MSVNPKYALQNVPGKGKGLVATQDIPKGTRITEETPKRAPRGFSLRSQVNALNDEQRQAFQSLANVHPYKNADERYLGVFRTNALPMASNDEGGLFIEACRINHACDNNASSDWNANIQKHTIHAVRDIQKSEEITISYLGSRPWPREIRRRVLQDKFKFLCSCSLCALPTKESRKTDRELMNIASIMTLVPGTFIRYPLQAYHYMDQAVQLFSRKGLGVRFLGGLFAEASTINIGHGDLARARILAQRAIAYMIMYHGGDSTQARDNKLRASHPSMGSFYRSLSSDWAKSIHDVPSGLDSDEFEDWLWRREGLQNSQIYSESPASFLSHSIFPTFLALPHRKQTSPEFYESIEGSSQRPRRHWCFLGHILDFETSPPIILVKDINDTIVELSLKANARDIVSRLRKAHTVAILYAQRDGTTTEPEMRLENVSLL
ncbi:hypothetical protein ACHAO8_005628 [Botrytis cinerea]